VSDLARDVLRRCDRMAAQRSTLEQHWQEIAELVAPMQADFTIRDREKGQKRGFNRFDSTPAVASDNLAAGLWGSITNSANKWFDLTHPDRQVLGSQAVKAWLNDTRDRMLDQFGAAGNRFYSHAYDYYRDLGRYGTAIMYVDEAVGEGRIRFNRVPLQQCFIAADDEDRVTTLHRKWKWTGAQAYGRWGDALPLKIRDTVREHPDREWTFVHAVEPNDKLDSRYRDRRGMAFRSCHISVECMEVLQEGGFDDFPYMVARWATDTGGPYGDSPAMNALTDIKVLNSASKAFLRASQKAADPTILAPDENANLNIRMVPGGVVYGAVNADGRALVQPFETRANFAITDAFAEQRRQAIRDAFFASLMLMTSRPGATATEVLARQEEQLRLMGPNLGRVQSEFLDPLIGRVFNIMWRGGAFAAAPEELAAAPVVKVNYVSPLARAQKASEGAAIMRFVESVAPIAQAQPDVLQNVDGDAMVRGLAEAFGLPPMMLRDPRAVLQMRQAAAQAAEQAQMQEQMGQVAAALPGLAGAAKDLSGAGVDVAGALEGAGA
jgi:hypothetical protein